jgi:hypothetical protein
MGFPKIKIIFWVISWVNLIGVATIPLMVPAKNTFRSGKVPAAGYNDIPSTRRHRGRIYIVILIVIITITVCIVKISG